MNFNASKDQLFARYRLGTENALEKANLLDQPDVTVLQALTIYLSVLQHTGELKSAWILAGILVRMAFSMKMHRESSAIASILPFQMEMRRRLWWQICFIDSRSEDVQVSQCKISEGMFDTKSPVNTNDTSLTPGIPTPPDFVNGWTDMTVFLIHCEVWKLSRRLQSVTAASYPLPPTINETVEIFHHSRARIEDTYLKHLDPNHSLQLFVGTITRLFLAKINLVLHTKPRPSRSAEPRPADTLPSDELFMSSVSIVEYSDALLNEPGWSGWTWQIQSRQPPWHALRVVFGQLVLRSWGPICERAWSSARKFLDRLSESSEGDPRYQKLLVMVSAVQNRREHELHYQAAGASTNHTTISTAASILPAPLPQAGTDGTSTTWTPQESFPDFAENFNTSAFNDGILSAEMDWQAWDEMTGGSELSFNFWDMNSL